MNLLENKKIIITGASRGIGRAIAIKALEAGANVAITYNNSKKAVLSLLEETASCPGTLFYEKMDLSDKDDIQNAMNIMIKKLGGIDVLINNAGITKDKAIPFLDLKSWSDVIDTNLTGTYLAISKALLPMVSHRNGVIINLSSVTGITGSAGQANYSASKAGIIGLTKSLSRELGAYNIRVNAIAPGFVETDMTSTLKDTFVKDALDKIPLKRFAKPEEIASLAVFLASDQAAYITGQTIVIDGGMS